MMGQGRTKRSDQSAIASAEFKALMVPLGVEGTKPRLAVAVSGGPDSIALALLAKAWAQTRGGDVVGLVVDHGLRPESSSEAGLVAGWLRGWGMATEVLVWEGPKPSTGVQAEARAARYRLLVEKCDALKLRHLLLAHHRDDQAETFLLRLSRGSSVDGLACMTPVSRPAVETSTQVRLLRPLLAVPKSRLIATLREQGIPWIDDPSNQCMEFTRVRLRRVLEELAGEGLNSDRLSIAAERMARVRVALDATADELVNRAVHFEPAGFCKIGLHELRSAPEEISLRVLLIMLKWTGGAENIIRLERAERLHTSIICDDYFSGKTLGGCRVQVISRPHGSEKPNGSEVIVCREAAAAKHQLRLAPGTRANWDGRFQVSLPLDSESLSHSSMAVQPLLVRCLGEDGWRQISALVSDAARTKIPASARPSLPALWDHLGVAAVPLMNYRRAGLAPVFCAFTTNFRPSADSRV